MQNIRTQLLSREARNTILYFSSSIVNGLLSFLALPIFTKWLSPEDFGIYGYTEAINNFLLPFLILSLNSYYIKKYFDEDDTYKQKTLLSSIFWTTFIWTILFTILLSFVGDFIFEEAELKIPFFPYMLMTLIGNLALPFIVYLPLQYRMEKKALNYTFIVLIRLALILLISVILLEVFELGLIGRYWGLIAGNCIYAFICYFPLRKYLTFQLDLKLISNAIKVSFPLVVSAFAALAYDVLDRVFLERYVSVSDLGYYNVANRFGSIILMASAAIYKAFEPEIFRFSKEKNYSSITKIFVNTSIVMFAATLLLVVLSPFLIKVLTHNKFLNSIPVIDVLLVGYYIKYIYLMLVTYMVTVFKNREILWISIFGLIFLCFLNIWLIPIFGIIGAAYVKLGLSVLLVLSSWLMSGIFRILAKTMVIIFLSYVILILFISL